MDLQAKIMLKKKDPASLSMFTITYFEHMFPARWRGD